MVESSPKSALCLKMTHLEGNRFLEKSYSMHSESWLRMFGLILDIRMCCSFYWYLPIRKSDRINDSYALAVVQLGIQVYLLPVKYLINRKIIATYKTAPLFLYSPIKLATYSLVTFCRIFDHDLVLLYSHLTSNINQLLNIGSRLSCTDLDITEI